MAKRFKLKLSRVIPSFQSCRSKDPSIIPSNPVPSFLRFSPSPLLDLHYPPPPPPPSCKPYHSSIRRHVSSAFNSIGCGLGSRSTANYPSETDNSKSPLPPPTHEFHWEKEEKWHVVAKVYEESPRQKIYNSSASGESDNDKVMLPPPPSPNTERKKRRPKKKRMTPRSRISTSSADSGLFSSEGFDNEDMNNEETEALVSSSRSFSSDCSSEFNPNLETIRESPFLNMNRRKKPKKAKRCVSKNGKKARKSCEVSMSPARLSKFQWLIPCTVEGKVRESFAVVKKSEDPYEDFKRSMMEMILEKQMFEEKDLEQLLHCFLSLNSRNHHGVIVQAFAEIWEGLFCRRRSSSNSTTSCRFSKAF